MIFLRMYSYNHKWDKPSFHAVANTGITLETLGYVVQGYLLKNSITTPILQYQDDCGVVLLDEVVPEQLATSMNWTINLARHYCTLMDGYRNATITTITGKQGSPTIGDFPALLDHIVISADSYYSFADEKVNHFASNSLVSTQ